MAMTYDEARQVVVLFGGSDGYLTVPPGRTHRFDTWTWDGNAWSERKADPAPDLSDPLMAYDPSSRSVLLFGVRLGGGATPTATWTWDGSGWKHLFPARSPAAHVSGNLAYDPASKRILLFGGFNHSEGYLNDLWTWDGNSWVEEHPMRSPSPRVGAAMAAAPGGLLLFGGSQGGKVFGDTWRWTGTSWAEATPGAAPRPRAGAAAVYDGVHQALVLFGGAIPEVGLTNELWKWDLSGWVPLGASARPA
jgi:hypothetical protein